MYDVEGTKKKAIDNKDHAQYSLAKYYWNSGEKDKAIHWLKRAAINNNPQAQFFLVWARHNGYNLKLTDSEQKEMDAGLKCLKYQELYGKSPEKYNGNTALRIFVQAAEHGEIQAQYVLGLLLYKSVHLLKVNKNTEQAIYFATKAAKQGCIGACNVLQDIYADANTKFYDLDKAIYFCERGMEYGDTTRSYNLYVALSQKYKGVLNKEQVLSYIDKVNGDHDAKTLLTLAQSYMKGTLAAKDYRKTLQYAEECFKIAPADSKTKQYAADIVVGVSGHPETRGLIKVDIVGYFEKRAILHGDIHAMEELGEYYRRQKQYDKAQKWFEQAAKLGGEFAQHQLGKLYQYGLVSNDVNYKEAFYWISLSARKGNSHAWCSLAELYRYGNGVDKSMLKAMDCYKKAISLGNEKAKEKYEQIRQEISRLLGEQ